MSKLKDLSRHPKEMSLDRREQGRLEPGLLVELVCHDNDGLKTTMISNEQARGNGYV